MRPDDNRPSVPIAVPSRPTPITASPRSASNEAAANVVRSQIDAIYQSDPNVTMPVNATTTSSDQSTEPLEPAAMPSLSASASSQSQMTPGPGPINLQAMNQQADVENPYERTHDEQRHEVQTGAWQKYHSAWQSYYQQYYERYYMSQVHETKHSLEMQAALHTPLREPNAEETISSDEAMYDLRSKLRAQVGERARKIRKSRHFMPTMAAVAVMLVFVFLQYNRVLFATVDAYISPGSLDPSTLIVDPSASGAVGPDPVLIIPKISVNVPIIWDANAASEDSLNAAMAKGVAWFDIQGASAKPGEIGNFVLSGHSSNDWLDQGDYKFIFARLDQLSEGDTIYVNYNSTRYTYVVTKKAVVQPTDVSALTAPITKPEITLITCTPLGTAINRLLIFADQVSPDPKSAATSKTSTSAAKATQMPANSPTFLQRLFGGK